MARTVLETEVEQHIVTEGDAQGLPAMLDEAQQLTVAQAAVIGTMDALKAIGRIETANFFATVADKLIAEAAINIRESKQYKGLPYKDADGNMRQVADFSEFCEVFLGKSYRRTMELVGNYNMLGANLYEQAEKIGFRQRDYNALKALPSDDRQLIAKAIEEENLDKALDLMQEMVARHLREKEAMNKKAEDMAHSLEAKDQVIQDKTHIINNQAEKLALLETKQRNVSAEQRFLDARSNLQITAANIKAAVMASLRKHMKDLYELDGDHSAFAGGLLIEIVRELHILRDEYNLPTTVSEDLTPEWMRDDVMADIEKQFSALPTVSDILNGEE